MWRDCATSLKEIVGSFCACVRIEKDEQKTNEFKVVVFAGRKKSEFVCKRVSGSQKQITYIS